MNTLMNALRIAKETDKAVAVANSAYHAAKETAAYDVKELSSTQIALLREGSSLIWLPKSQIEIEEGHVVKMAEWLAKKNDFETVEAQAAQAERFDKYEALVAAAKAAGIKGIRAGMRAATIRAKASASGIALV